MKKHIAALALFTVIAVQPLSTSASAAAGPVESAFGDNG
jgi:hypothetical protein